jgi:hypothetical protein
MSRSRPQPSRVRNATAFLALALTLLGSLQAAAPGSLVGRSTGGGEVGCVDACGCPPSSVPASCCCESDTGEAPGGSTSLAVLIGGSGCIPPAPRTVSASPAGPILAAHTDVALPTPTDLSPSGHLETRAPTARATRPPVPPPRS